MNLSLDQYMPPSALPKTSGGFLSRYPTNPSKLKSLREPLDIAKTRNGPSTALQVDLERAQSPTALERRVALERTMANNDLSQHFPYPPYDPSQSAQLDGFNSQIKDRGTSTVGFSPMQKPKPVIKRATSLVGGLGGQMLLSRSVDALAKAAQKREQAGTQTEPELERLDFEDLQTYSTWTKKEMDPFFRDLRKHVLANRPVDVGVFLEAYGRAMQKGEPLPETRLPNQTEYDNDPATTDEMELAKKEGRTIGVHAAVRK